MSRPKIADFYVANDFPEPELRGCVTYATMDSDPAPGRSHLDAAGTSKYASK